MSERNEAVIVGGGLAAAKAVESLRENGLEGGIVLIGEEAELPYERPPVSKDYLRGESDREAARPHPAEFYAENEIEAALIPGACLEVIRSSFGHCAGAPGRDPAAMAQIEAAIQRLLME